MSHLRVALAHIRRFLPLRLVLIAAVVLAGLTLGRPGADLHPVAAMAAAQSPGTATWSFAAPNLSPSLSFNVSGVAPLAPAGSTQTWTVDLQPSYAVRFQAGAGLSFTTSAPQCELFPAAIACLNQSAAAVSIVIRMTLPTTPGVYEVDGVGTAINAVPFVQANLFLVATAAADPQCVVASTAHTSIQADVGGRC